MKLIYDKITYVENIFNKIHYDTFKVLSSKDREFNYVLLIKINKKRDAESDPFPHNFIK